MNKFFVVLLSVFFTNSFFAEKINKQTIEIQALENNPSIAAVKLKLNISKQEYNKSLSAFFPTINFYGKIAQKV
ncbi:MAG: TolC family protein [Endomicrobium sp.]|jgi:outer membrane protein TolC|nr:TolC family protein [Endomicrobium sp.]